MSDLITSWNRAWQGIGANGSGSSVQAALIARYSEPHRHYHTMQHLAECLHSFEEVATLAENPVEVELAIWFHDAIYDVKRSDNEERSARWAKSELAAHDVSAQRADYVHALIMVTKHSALPMTQDEKVLVDVDLSILGASDARFDEYERQIRDEYSFVPAWLFKRKRRAILMSFLERKAIYSTEHFAATLEQQARANLLRAVGKKAA